MSKERYEGLDVKASAQKIMTKTRRPGKFRLKPFGQGRAVWNLLTARTPDTSLYHSERWIDLLAKAYGLQFFTATIESDSEIRAGAVLARCGHPFSRRLVSIPFSDSCAPLHEDDESLRMLLSGLSALGVPCEIRGAPPAAAWQTVDCFVLWTIDMNRTLAALERGLSRDYRRRIRQALKDGVKIERGADMQFLKRFYSLQLETRRRQGLPPQPWRFFQFVREALAPTGDFEVWIASSGGRDCTAEVNLRHGDRLYYKWSARIDDPHPGASHLLLWSIMEQYVGRVATLDLGRADIRNRGLNFFKQGIGGFSAPLPYAFFPTPSREISSEALTGPRKLATQIWRRLPLGVTRLVGGALYRFLA